MSVGSLAFLSARKIVFIDLDKVPVQKGNLVTGQICGTSKNRKSEFKKPNVRWHLKQRLDFQPICFQNKYRQIQETSTERFIDGSEIVKKLKPYWQLQESEYFSVTDIEKIGLYTSEYSKMFDKEILPKVKQLPYHERKDKYMSMRSSSKIKSKIENWYDVKLTQVGGNEDKLNFQFITFTVTTPNFDHALIVRAWKNFMSHYKEILGKYNKSFNYLWVAEKQDGSRYLKQAAKCKGLIEKGVNVELNKKRFDALILKASNPTNNIHYHMLVDKGHKIDVLNRLWLVALENVGAKRYNEFGKELNPVQFPEKQPCKKCSVCLGGAMINCNNKYRPKLNALKIKSYLAKYMTKSDAGLKCLLWHSSNKVSETATTIVNCDIKEAPILAWIDGIKERSFILCKIAIEKLGKVFNPLTDMPRLNVTYKKFENCTVIFFNKPTKWFKALIQPLLDYNLKIFSPTPKFVPFPE
ncbi:MAG: hypothetical protein H7239_15220 [Flavobacterium sp.]|nr:hypothetical protein [Flavobacterium sp.]